MTILELDSPDAAEQAFYQAFAHADLEMMMAVWAADEAVVCVHPLGARHHGLTAVERGWREIFASGVPMQFQIVQGQRMRATSLAVHSVIEEIQHGPRLRQRARVIATNVYRRFEDGWRIVLHHGSPAESESGGGIEPPAAPGVLH